MASYAEWIEAFVSSQPSRFVRGKCDTATAKMVAAFPELRRVAGFVYCTWGREQHWWCVAPDGSIIDPTASQYVAILEYEELDLDDPEVCRTIPTGVCMDCGGDTYEGRTFCSDQCESATLAYLNSPGGW